MARGAKVMGNKSTSAQQLRELEERQTPECFWTLRDSPPEGFPPPVTEAT